MRFNESVCREKLAEAYERCVHGKQNCTTNCEKSAYMISWLEKIVKELDIPTSLKDFNVPIEDLDFLVDAGIQVTRLLQNNMRKLTAKDVRDLYLKLM